MNLYFLLEDSRSFIKVLPLWMKFILPNFSEVVSLYEFKDNNKCFMVQSGFGYPSIKNHFENSLDTISENNIPVSHFVVCWDTDARDLETINSDKKIFKEIFSRYTLNCELKLLVIDRCFETWLLGNRRVYFSSCDEEKFIPFAQFYNVGKYDPEKMYSPPNKTVSSYHLKYLQEMLRNSYLKKNYSKGSPLAVSTKEYYEELYSRVYDTNDLSTLRVFIDFLKSIEDVK